MSTLLFYLPLVVAYTIVAIYAERKISAFIQSRLGPMETGRYGVAQTVADLLKLIQKEDIIPSRAEGTLFKIAPLVIFTIIFTGFAMLPVSMNWTGSGASSGLFLLLAILALDVVGIIIAGWSSNNKYSTLGAFRSAAQIISYEIPLGLSVLCVCMVCQTLDLQEISLQQSTASGGPQYFFGLQSLELETKSIGGFLTWNVVRMPLLFIAWLIFFISSLAQSNRAPFDLPEAESELVAGYHTEYTGFRWAIIMLAEYAMMLLVSLLGAIMFFGSWNSPFPNIGSLLLADWTNGTGWGGFWLISKAFFFVGVQMWVRWTFPRLRIDQLMNVSWKLLLPVSLALVILCGFWRLTIVS